MAALVIFDPRSRISFGIVVVDEDDCFEPPMAHLFSLSSDQKKEEGAGATEA